MTEFGRSDALDSAIWRWGTARSVQPKLQAMLAQSQRAARKIIQIQCEYCLDRSEGWPHLPNP